MTQPQIPHLSFTDWIVLALVNEEPRHGFSIARALRPEGEIGEVWTVSRPPIYRSLARLESLKLVTAVATERGEKGSDRTIFEITPAAHLLVLAWLGEPVKHPREARTELIAKLLLRQRLNLEIQTLAHAQLEYFRPILDGLEKKAQLQSQLAVTTKPSSPTHRTDRDEGRSNDEVLTSGIVSLLRLESLRATMRVLTTLATTRLPDGR